MPKHGYLRGLRAVVRVSGDRRVTVKQREAIPDDIHDEDLARLQARGGIVAAPARSIAEQRGDGELSDDELIDAYSPVPYDDDPPAPIAAPSADAPPPSDRDIAIADLAQRPQGELREMAAQLELSGAGTKAELAARIVDKAAQSVEAQ